jgi:hypothetical protein
VFWTQQGGAGLAECVPALWVTGAAAPCLQPHQRPRRGPPPVSQTASRKAVLPARSHQVGSLFFTTLL